MKKVIGSILILTLLVVSAACKKQEIHNNSPKGAEQLSTTGTFVYEGSGFGGGVFHIKIHDDGSFSYQQGSASNYYGTGTWSLQDDILCMEDDTTLSGSFVNYFKVEEDALIFQSENSTNFMYVELSNGDRFTRATVE